MTLKFNLILLPYKTVIKMFDEVPFILMNEEMIDTANVWDEVILIPLLYNVALAETTGGDQCQKQVLCTRRFVLALFMSLRTKHWCEYSSLYIVRTSENHTP